MEKINLDNLINVENKELKFKYNGNTIVININEDIDVDLVSTAIDDIVDNIVNSDFTYELYEYMLGYYILRLFTNVEIPIMKINDSESDESTVAPNYSACNTIVSKLDLTNKLCNASSIVNYYLGMLEKNIWRKLEYKKSLSSLIPFNSLMDALVEFYNIMDDLDKIVDKEKEMDINEITSNMSELSNVINKFNEYTENKKAELKNEESIE